MTSNSCRHDEDELSRELKEQLWTKLGLFHLQTHPDDSDRFSNASELSSSSLPQLDIKRFLVCARSFPELFQVTVRRSNMKRIVAVVPEGFRMRVNTLQLGQATPKRSMSLTSRSLTETFVESSWEIGAGNILMYLPRPGEVEVMSLFLSLLLDLNGSACKPEGDQVLSCAREFIAFETHLMMKSLGETLLLRDLPALHKKQLIQSYLQSRREDECRHTSSPVVLQPGDGYPPATDDGTLWTLDELKKTYDVISNGTDDKNLLVANENDFVSKVLIARNFLVAVQLKNNSISPFTLLHSTCEEDQPSADARQERLVDFLMAIHPKDYRRKQGPSLFYGSPPVDLCVGNQRAIAERSEIKVANYNVSVIATDVVSTAWEKVDGLTDELQKAAKVKRGSLSYQEFILSYLASSSDAKMSE